MVCVLAAPPEPAVDPRVLEVEAERVATIERVAPGVIVVFVPGSSAGGSGVLISPDGLALTNFHVTGGRNWFFCGLPGGRMVHAVLVGVDPVGDLALIKLIGPGPFAPVRLGDSDRLAVGEPVMALGNPFMLASDFEPTVSLGIISGLHRYQYPSQTLLEYTDAIQTDAAINPGNSGGALVNLRGELVGINGRASFDTRGRVNVGLAYAISINQAKNFLDHLAGGLIVDHASLGATLVRGESAVGGAVVDEIAETSDAYRLGLRSGDEIVAFARRSITSVNQFKGLLGTMPKGWRVPLAYRRGETEETIHLRLEGVHRPAELVALTKPKVAKPSAAKSVPPPVPDAVRALLEPRDGYANYYFQRQARERWLNELRKTDRASPGSGRWKLQLKGDDGVGVEIALTDRAASWNSGGAAFVFEPGTPSERPDARAAALAALWAWRWFLVRLHRGFERCDYVGGFPDADGVIHPALETVSETGMRAMWLIDRDAGVLRSLEYEVPADAHACTWSLGDYRLSAGRHIPHLWELAIAGKPAGRYTLTAAEIGP